MIVTIDTNRHMSLKECALKLGLSQAVLYNYRKRGRTVPFPEPYCELPWATLYDFEVIREWHKSVPEPGGPVHRKTRKPRKAQTGELIDGVEHVTKAEIARRYGISRQAVDFWTTKPDFPESEWELGRSLLYPWPDVRKWARKHHRQVPNRERTAT